MGRDPHRGPHKFHPSRAAKLDRPERQRFLPNEGIISLLALRGSETVLDYGAGIGVLSIPLARSLPGGIVYAVDESPEMLEYLRRRLDESGLDNVRAHLVRDNSLSLSDRSVDRVLALDLLHEVVGESALQEMRRVLRPDGFLLVVDWRADVEREEGPPSEVSLTPQAARHMLEEAGYDVAAIEDERFPYHFVYLARIPADARS